MPEITRYSQHFQNRAAVEAYEFGEYAAASYPTHVWQWQQPVIRQIIQDFRRERGGPVRLLDFACGTGRVLSFVESLVDAADGVDISADMIALARDKCHTARLLVGDILAEPRLVQMDYDLITVFRFLLNVEPEMRGRILRRLREVIHRDGRLIVNVHGNSRSLRHPAILWRRWRERKKNTGAMLNEMSPDATLDLLRNSGFEVVRQIGFGMLPPTLYRTPLRPLAVATDGWLAGAVKLKNISIDLMFVCRPV